MSPTTKRLKFTALVAGVAIALSAQAASAWTTGTFDENASGGQKLNGSVEDCRGVYIVYKNHDPYYVGMSNSSIRDRLLAHISGRGSRKIAEQLGQGNDLTYEWLCVDSPEQAEAQLIGELGTITAGNLRRETDPADEF
jgi:hypothetical protein